LAAISDFPIDDVICDVIESRTRNKIITIRFPIPKNLYTVGYLAFIWHRLGVNDDFPIDDVIGDVIESRTRNKTITIGFPIYENLTMGNTLYRQYVNRLVAKSIYNIELTRSQKWGKIRSSSSRFWDEFQVPKLVPMDSPYMKT